MTVSSDPLSARQRTPLSFHNWHLCISCAEPECFQLKYADQVIFQGYLELENNGQPLDCSNVHWHFRERYDRFEQWCQLQHADSLSISMSYYFHQGALVIDYLARNSIPTRLDIRHKIVQSPNVVLPQSLATGGDLNFFPSLQHQRNGLPSEHLSKTARTDLFREAFSATQWIVLEKM